LSVATLLQDYVGELPPLHRLRKLEWKADAPLPGRAPR
jgi:hypothetical protein